VRPRTARSHHAFAQEIDGPFEVTQPSLIVEQCVDRNITSHSRLAGRLGELVSSDHLLGGEDLDVVGDIDTGHAMAARCAASSPRNCAPSGECDNVLLTDANVAASTAVPFELAHHVGSQA